MRRVARKVQNSYNQLVEGNVSASRSQDQPQLFEAGVTAAITRSRELSSVEKYDEAFAILQRGLKEAKFNSAEDTIQMEMHRIHLILGDHKSSWPADQKYDSQVLESNPCQALKFIESEFNSISMDLEMDGPVKSATSLYQTYRPLLSPETVSEYVIRILYYCLEIQYFWRLYGDGITAPLIEHDQELLQDLLLRLTNANLIFEALEVAEYFVEGSEPVLKAMATSLAKKDRGAATTCTLRLAKVCGEQGRLQDVRKTLTTAKKYGRKTKKQQLYEEMLVQRFLGSQNRLMDRIEQLEQISVTLFELRYYDGALQPLEYAAELVSLLPNFSQAASVGARIHDSLKMICDRSGDALSGIIFKFRHCDLLNAYENNTTKAVEERQRLLSSNECAKLPYLQRFHKRQWMEYFILRQRDCALHEAEQYLEYCHCCRNGEETSLAENMLVQTMLQPQRESKEMRINMLESVRTRLEQGMAADESHGWHHAQLEKQILLVEVVDELGRLQEIEMEEIITNASEILERAAATSRKVNLKAESAYINHEIAFLKGAASLYLERPHDFTDFDAGQELLGAGVDLAGEEGSLSFDRTRYLQQLVFAIRNECLPIFETLLKQLDETKQKFVSQENAAGHAAVLGIKAMVYYLIMEFDSPAIGKFRRAAGFETLVKGAKMALKMFTEIFDLREKIEQEVENTKENSANRMHALTMFQSYFTGEVEQLYFDIALELVIGLGDSAQTWRWIQRRKARGLSKMLRNLFPVEDLKNAPEYLNSRNALTFEDLRWAQSASTTKLIFVDWISYGTCPPKLLFFSFRTDQSKGGAVTTMVEIDVSIEDLRESLERINEARMDDPDAERYLRSLIPVLQPVEECSSPGDILLFSPTAPLHNAPLHAISVGSITLIERNPIAYVPSHAALVSYLQRLSASDPDTPPPWKAEVFAAYDDTSVEAAVESERRHIYGSIGELGRRLGATEATIGKDLTADSFKRNASGASLLHFHGHGFSHAHSPAQQSLILSSPTQRLTLLDAASLNLGGGSGGGGGAHVTMIACSGGLQDFSLSGDEPLGLLSSFLLGGATSVIGALWPIQSSTGRLFTQLFYNYFLDHVDRTEMGPIVNLAKALQHSILEIKKNKDTRMHYHWAPFVLYGVWFCRRKPGSW